MKKENCKALEEISLLDNFSEEKEINGNLEEKVFRNFESEINEEELIEDKDFLTENFQHNLVVKETREIDKRHKRPARLPTYTTKFTKECIDKISKLENLSLIDFVEKAIEEYKIKNYPDLKVEEDS